MQCVGQSAHLIHYKFGKDFIYGLVDELQYVNNINSTSFTGQ